MYRIQILPLLLLCFTSHSVWATEWFKNSAQQAQEAFAQKAYEKSANLFTDPYQRGVALYRNGQYADAAEAFASVTRPETRLKAQYNLGNAYFQQGNYQKAIEAYDKVLAEHPTDEDAKHNLELAKQLLNSQEQEKKPAQSSQKQDKGSQDQKSSSAENEKKQDSEQQPDEQTAQSNVQNTDATQKAENAQSQAQNEQSMNQETASPDEPSAQENSDSSKMAEQQPTTEQPSTGTDTASTSALPNEEDVMAEVLLNRLDENPQRLLRGQFYLDAKRSEAPLPTKPW